MQRYCHPLIVIASGVMSWFLLFDRADLLNYGLTIGTIIVLWLAAKSKAASALLEMVTTTAEKRKAVIDERDAELARVTVELKLTTRELRQAREFTVEDRLKIRELEIRCLRYEREINHHRIKAGMSPLLAGSEDDVEHQQRSS